jgi:hypothetical protein
MGISYLNTGELFFEPYKGNRSEIDPLLKSLDEAYKLSRLETLPEGRLRNILYNARIRDLNEENDCSYIADSSEYHIENTVYPPSS